MPNRATYYLALRRQSADLNRLALGQVSEDRMRSGRFVSIKQQQSRDDQSAAGRQDPPVSICYDAGLSGDDRNTPDNRIHFRVRYF